MVAGSTIRDNTQNNIEDYHSNHIVAQETQPDAPQTKPKRTGVKLLIYFALSIITLAVVALVIIFAIQHGSPYSSSSPGPSVCFP